MKIFSIAAPSAGRDVAMRRDRGCAVEVRCLLLRDREHCDREYHSWALRLPNSSADSWKRGYLTLALHSFVGAPSAEPQGWQTTSGEAIFAVFAFLGGLG